MLNGFRVLVIRFGDFVGKTVYAGEEQAQRTYEEMFTIKRLRITSFSGMISVDPARHLLTTEVL
jgi:hypothetical protein